MKEEFWCSSLIVVEEMEDVVKVSISSVVEVEMLGAFIMPEVASE